MPRGTIYRTDLSTVRLASTPRSRWGEMVASVESSTTALEGTARARSAEGAVHNAYELSGPHLWNPWEWTEQPSSVSGCPPELLVWADVWAGAMANLAALGEAPVPRGATPREYRLWDALLDRNIALLGPASNIQPTFFRAGKPLDVPGWRRIDGGTRPYLKPTSSGLALATEHGSEPEGAHAAGANAELIMGEAPLPGAAGFIEVLGAVPVTRSWQRGYALARNRQDAFAAALPGPLPVGATPLGPTIGPAETFYVDGPNGAPINKTAPERGWDVLLEQWSARGGVIRTYEIDDSRFPVDVELDVYFADLCAYATWLSKLTLPEVLLRSAAFYAAVYAPWAIAHGFPDTANLAQVAQQLWQGLETRTREAQRSFMTSSTEGAIVGGAIASVGAVVTAVFPPAGAMIAIAVAVVEALNALLVEIGGAAVGHGVYTVQPLFVRQFSGDCRAPSLALSAGAAMRAVGVVESSRAAMAGEIELRNERTAQSSVPWKEIAVGVGVATVIGVGIWALEGGKRT